MRILVVEDEHKIAQSLKAGLENEAYAVDVAYDGEDGYNTARTGEYDLIILDVMMPIMDGVEVSNKLRAERIHTPILMLTAKDQPRDVVRGLDNGADDYLAKPFSFEVLLARVRALLRRPSQTENTELAAADIRMDTSARSVRRGGTSIALSAKEYALLEYLLRNKDKVLSKDAIISHVWDFDADILPNTVEVFIAYLRNKIERPFSGPKIIHTMRGFGYKLSDNP